VKQIRIYTDKRFRKFSDTIDSSIRICFAAWYISKKEAAPDSGAAS